MQTPLLEAARPRQWVKNLFVAAPLVFAKRLTALPQSGRAFAAVVLFCALSSAVYLWNDIIDVEKDRAHPHKRLRPIASGRLPIGVARNGGIVLAVVGIGFGYLLEPRFALVALAYLALNVAYSLVLKRVVYVDVVCIASGFLLRVLGGALAIGVESSHYLLLCTGLLACFLGFGKRLHELTLAGARAESQRTVLASYRASVLSGALLVTGFATWVVYVLYTRAPHTVAFFQTANMQWTAPCAAFGLLRFRWLVARSDVAESPTDAILKDGPFMANFVLWAVAILIIIYFR